MQRFYGLVCEIDNCDSERRVIGKCEKSSCCVSGCGRHFCTVHDGKHYLNLPENGKVCEVCAQRMKKCRKRFGCIGFTLLIFLILALVSAVILFRDEE